MKKNGFTLNEIGIVVMIIAAIAAIAIANLLRSRTERNERTAVLGLKTILAAQEKQHASTGKYATSFAELQGTQGVDWSKDKLGYVYSLKPGAKGFELKAVPTVPGIMANRFYRVDSSGEIHYALEDKFDDASPKVEGDR